MEKIPNGGFPPLALYKKEKIRKLKNNEDKEKYSSVEIRNINIKEILNTTSSKPIITDNDNIEEIDEI
jgi:hypothetical protein